MKPATWADWVDGARLRTLPLAIAPVLIGTGASVVTLGDQQWHWLRALGCLAVALFLQIAVNFANDYSDGVRGADVYRVGPSRLTGSGKARPRTVLVTALVFFALAGAVGLALVIVTEHWWLIAVGAAAIVAAWFYTGGKHPYGYHALGEVAVFVFFGLVATAGTAYILAGQVGFEGWLGGVEAGLLACAVLVANNLRDIDTDRRSGKHTLSVRLGARGSKILFCALVFVAYLIVAFFGLFFTFAWLTLFTLLLAIPACLIVVTGRTSVELVLGLKLISIAALANGAFLCVAFGVVF
ncbi:MAG TPA: 1,4-dihydroxy-2-naphthoate polyprenyltransferase [Microbacteriaceae bacterium]|nr:1,4-dihydroxy-2-naphthoate polyprenyltransferase [Microbacteriaceae bacterium]